MLCWQVFPLKEREQTTNFLAHIVGWFDDLRSTLQDWQDTSRRGTQVSVGRQGWRYKADCLIEFMMLSGLISNDSKVKYVMMRSLKLALPEPLDPPQHL